MKRNRGEFCRGKRHEREPRGGLCADRRVNLDCPNAIRHICNRVCQPAESV
jgi:hypothetical protein